MQSLSLDIPSFILAKFKHYAKWKINIMNLSVPITQLQQSSNVRESWFISAYPPTPSRIFKCSLFSDLCLAALGSLLLWMGFLQLRQAGNTLRCPGIVFSLCWLLLLQSTCSVHLGFRSCCLVVAQLLCSLRNLPRPEIKPRAPALAEQITYPH